MNTHERYSPLFDELLAELHSAESMHPDYHSYHEAHGVILEELDEFWDVVRMKSAARETHEQRANTRAELIQIAATALRAIRSLKL